MSGTIWTKWYWSDWETDQALKLCSFAAQGLWMRMLCIAASHDPIGYVAVAGRALDATDIARLTGGSEGDVQTLIADLERNGVFSRDRHNRIYSRRMIRDARASAIARKNGKNGGNPNLRKDEGNPPRDNPPVKGRHKPHKPTASTKVRAPNSALNLSGAKDDALADGAPPSRAKPVLEIVREDLATRQALAATVLKPKWQQPDAPSETQAEMAERLRKVTGA